MSKNNKGGVKTDKGKEISKYNAQKHTILRESITKYENVDYQIIYEDLVEDLKPKGKTQEMIVEIIALNTIKLVRIAKSEAERIKQMLSNYVKGEMEFDVVKPGYFEYNPELDFTSKYFKLFARYQTATENRIYKAITMLKMLQNE